MGRRLRFTNSKSAEHCHGGTGAGDGHGLVQPVKISFWARFKTLIVFIRIPNVTSPHYLVLLPPSRQHLQCLLHQMYPAKVRRGHAKQGRIGLRRPVRGQVYGGQHQDWRVFAEAGAGECWGNTWGAGDDELRNWF